MNKLALGTVQFGLDYGINNIRGKIPENEVVQILNLAKDFGINILDTAHNYGESEKVIGHYLSSYPNSFRIISKLPDTKDAEIIDVLEKSLRNLNIDTIYGYLLHDFQSFMQNKSIINTLEQLKKQGKISKYGFSLYYPSELESLLNENVSFDIIQVPYNVFDQRFVSYFGKLKDRGVEIYTRSAFLQGLVFKNPQVLPPHLTKIGPKIIKLRRIAQEIKLSISTTCLCFVLKNPLINKVVIGVNNLTNLRENLESLKSLDKIDDAYQELSKLADSNEQIIVPTHWS